MAASFPSLSCGFWLLPIGTAAGPMRCNRPLLLATLLLLLLLLNIHLMPTVHAGPSTTLVSPLLGLKGKAVPAPIWLKCPVDFSLDDHLLPVL